MTAIAATLAAVEIGHPLERGPLALFPLFSDAPSAAPYRTQAPLRVGELDDGADVNTLQLAVDDGLPLLLLAGEVVLGNKQDRTLDVSVLLPPRVEVQVPVSCVEQGRWGEVRAASRADHLSPSQLRSRNLHAVARNVATDARVAGDQGEVWNTVEEYVADFEAPAPTRALADAHRAARTATADVSGTTPLPGQRGVVAAAGGRVLGFDLFDRPEVLEERWLAIVAGYAMDARATGERVRRRHVRSFLGGVARCPVTEAPGVGLGRTLHPLGDDLGALALEWNEVIVHLTAGTVRHRQLLPY